MFNTVSTRDLQRQPKTIMEKANKLNKPLVIITGNKPAGAIIGLELLRALNALLDRLPDRTEVLDVKTEKRLKQAVKDLQEEKYSVAATEDDIDNHLQSL